MKKILINFILLVTVLLIIPFIFTFLFSNCTEFNKGNDIKIYDVKKNKIYTMGLETYLVGVVSAEMPASFEKEALKAQSVAARTYSLRKILSNSAHENGADLCTDFGHCQAFLSDEELKQKWGKDYSTNINKIKSAVKDTYNEYVSFEDDFASTVYHASSNGKTESAEDVWGKEYDYLVSVESFENFNERDFSSEVTVSKEDFINELNGILESERIKITDEITIGDICYTAGENIKTIQICGILFEGKTIRTAFGLKSTSFNIYPDEKYIVIKTLGNGHGVGMSQYGAHFMAHDGKNYKQILSHYYKGTEIKKYK